MHGLKKHFFKRFFLLVLSLSFVSCGSLNFFKKPAGNAEPVDVTVDTNGSHQMEISGFESELTGIKKDQADLILQMENRNTTIDRLHNKVSRLEKKILLLEQNKLPARSVQTKIKYTNPANLYKKARNLLLEEDYLNAVSLFTELIKRYPRDSLADNAAYWLGECHYSLGDHKKAILVFKNLVIQYPKSEKVPDAMLKTGYSYFALDDSNRSHHYLKQVLKQYPFSPAAEKAQEKLRSFE